MNYSYLENRRYHRKKHIRYVMRYDQETAADTALECVLRIEEAVPELIVADRDINYEPEQPFMCDFRDLFPDDVYSF